MSSTWSPEQYLTTIRFAAEAHNGQTVTGTDLPYLLHISIVAMELINALGAEPSHNADLAVACALLHDVIEDTSVSYADVTARFGSEVAAGVQALTKNSVLPKQDQMRDSLQRIRSQPAEVWMVKLADRICNLQPPPAHWSPERVVAYRSEAQLILETLGDASPHLAERLRGKIANYGEGTREQER
jgi:(p)ppGpp synthase/HD superfamily hydrolase